MRGSLAIPNDDSQLSLKHAIGSVPTHTRIWAVVKRNLREELLRDVLGKRDALGPLAVGCRDKPTVDKGCDRL